MAATSDRNRIRGVDAIAGLALEGWLTRSARDDARLSQEHIESMRRNKLAVDKPLPEGVHVDLLDNRQLRRFRNALSSNTEATGAGLVPSGTFISAWETALDSLPLRRLVTVDRVPRGGEHYFPTTDDRTTGSGYLLSENATERACHGQGQPFYLESFGSGRVDSEFTHDASHGGPPNGPAIANHPGRRCGTGQRGSPRTTGISAYGKQIANRRERHDARTGQTLSAMGLNIMLEIERIRATTMPADNTLTTRSKYIGMLAESLAKKKLEIAAVPKIRGVEPLLAKLRADLADLRKQLHAARSGYKQ